MTPILKRLSTIAVVGVICVNFVYAFATNANKEIPRAPKHYVYDETGLVSKKTIEILDQTFYEHESATTEQIVFSIFKSLEGEDLVDYTNRVFAQWKLGQRGKDNGALVAIYWVDRKIRVEVGYGLEPTLTDAKSKRLINDIIVPALKSGDLNYALINSAQAILEELGSPLAQAEQNKLLENAKRLKPLPSRIKLGIAPLLFLLLLVMGFIGFISRSGSEHYRATGWRTSRNPFPIFPGGRAGGFGSMGGFGGGGGGLSGGGGASGSW